MASAEIAQDMFSIAGKVAIVTGGSSGIGLMIARSFVRAGARVYIVARRAAASGEVARELSAFGQCVSLPADLSLAGDRQALFQQLAEREQRLSILVNCAGTAWVSRLDDQSDAGIAKLLTLNVGVLLSLTRDLVPFLERAATPGDPARVINVGSIDGLAVPTLQQIPMSLYAATKAAVHHLSRGLAVELGPRNITVNAIAPGFFPSRMSKAMFEHFGDRIVRSCPLGRTGVAEDIAGTAVYLASRAGAYTNGAVIPVDGGTHLAYASTNVI